MAFVLVASLMFAASNVAWRFGDGSTVAVVALRAGLGTLVAWLIVRRRSPQAWWWALRCRSGRTAAAVSAATMLAAATMFRTLDGPLAGLALACTPAVALLVRDRVGPRATWAALGSSAAAIVGLVAAAFGTTTATRVTPLAVAAAVAFVALEVWSMRTSQRAVQEGVDPSSLVMATMVLAAVALTPVAAVQRTTLEPSVLAASAAAALVVAVLGTMGRVLRTAALPAAGVPAVAASAQVTALGTAAGGVLVLGDSLTWFGVTTAIVAAALGALAVLAATSWRLATGRSGPASLAGAGAE
ncbi:hypothetical protein [Rhabdothermincola salaria]|uniref:hypothetical protein n=1 Tax=Rhabdothermincola salaria TaxID=2903142 RepID=UPI001E340893|nr:hypothetical protein [Rhabdothermincola salaria]MCD9623286.1 hypothetical protein [Rhabdothermincola salaria]